MKYPGKEAVIHSFGSDTDGSNPYGALIQTSNGLLYGMTYAGGAKNKANGGNGIIFSYNINTGKENILYNFGCSLGNTCISDGFWPHGSLILASDSSLYGMTSLGGVNDSSTDGGGIIFSFNISTNKETDIHNFGRDTDGRHPNGSLIQASDSLLYGMTSYGVADSNKGIIFSYNINTGKETNIHDFGRGTDGWAPNGSLIQAKNGLLYGMTGLGGVNDSGTIFSYNISTGIENDLHDFTGSDGFAAGADLLEVDSGTTTVINQLSFNNNHFSIFPNHTSGELNIKFTGNQNGYIVQVYNIMGEQVYHSVLTNSQSTINLSAQPDGMYFVYLKSDEDLEVGKVLVTR